MIEYLKDYHISNDDYELIKLKFDKNMILNFSVMKSTVCEALAYFKQIGITNLTNIVLYRPDLCFKPKSYLEEQFKNLDFQLIKYVIENNIDDLNSFNI